jgi:hypothetical protein
MPGYSLVPVDYQPDFEGVSLVPVDYDPFAADGATRQAPTQQAQAQPQGLPQQQPATGAGQPDAGALAAGGGPSGSQGGGIGPTGGAPNPTLDQGAAKAAPFGGYSLVPVDYQPDFGDYSLVPVGYDPFAADGLAQQAQFQQPPTPALPAQPQPQTQPQQPATGAGQPGVNGPATGNSPSGSGGVAGVKRFGGDEGGDFPSRNAGIGFESAESAWDAALKEMRDLGAQHYSEEAKSGGFIPELGVEIHKRGGLYYYDQIARGFQDGALGGGVGFGDSSAVARGHMHWDSQFESKPDLKNAEAYTQHVPNYNARGWILVWEQNVLA